ncbi:MAG: hypothetical protein CMB80_05465 [Flammeovirgaceae bacterium]|nr:hypothetical protein [Flammeovirgaceae bacterium]|tara:strand:+ start:2921 stop:3157 length:237 start_codon:yes stop_codon:yes gene_type:complete
MLEAFGFFLVFAAGGLFMYGVALAVIKHKRSIEEMRTTHQNWTAVPSTKDILPEPKVTTYNNKGKLLVDAPNTFDKEL